MSNENNNSSIDDLIRGGISIARDTIPSANSNSQNINEILEMSDEEVEKLRQEKLNQIQLKIDMLKSQVDQEDLDKYVLENKIELLEKAKFMLNEYMVTVISNLSNKHMAFEVLAKMFQMVSELNMAVIEVPANKINVKVENNGTLEGSVATIQNTNDLISSMIELNMERRTIEAQKKSNIKVLSS